MKRLEGKVAVITGAGAGIGAATAEIFCGEGASVMLVDADAKALAKTSGALRKAIPAARFETFTADVGDEDQAARAVGHALDALGGMDILVNNASMRNYTPVAETTPAQWQAMVAVNLVGIANYCKAALPALRTSARASIVNVSSCYAVKGRKGMGIYDATKAGILSLTRTLAHEEATHGVRVNAVCPGSTLTDFHVRRGSTKPHEPNLMGRWATPAEIAWPILWLASDEASFITGTTLMVDGGLSIR